MMVNYNQRRLTMKLTAVFTALALSAFSVMGEDFFVDAAKGNDANDGSKEKPFKTINAALRAVKDKRGDTVTLRGGVYRERFMLDNKSGSDEKPLVIQGAEGERVIISGFVPITDWKKYKGDIYSAAVKQGDVKDLYVGLSQQRVSRWPFDGIMRKVGSADKATASFSDPDGIPQIPELREIAENPASARAFFYYSRGNFFGDRLLKGIDFAKKSMTIDANRWNNGLGNGKNDRYEVVNHVSLIKKPGEWAFAANPDGKSGTVYFWPVSRDDLKNAAYRSGGLFVIIGYAGRPTRNITVRNLEICGASGGGIFASGVDGFTLEKCVIHNNGGDGAATRRCKNITLRSNIVVNNGSSGISVTSTVGGVIEGNEVAYNQIDGVRFAGNISGRPGVEPYSSDLTLRRNYLHHHIYQSHPDNFQCFRGVNKMKIQDNVFLFGGQNTMAEENDTAEFSNNISAFTGAYTTIFGHNNSHNWLVKDNTVGMGGWGLFLTGGSKGDKFERNLFFAGALELPDDAVSKDNYFVPYAYITEVGRFKRKIYRDFADFAAACGDTGAKSGVVKFRNAPAAIGVSSMNDANTDSYIELRQNGPVARVTDFAVGDNIEINGDSVLRKVTKTDAKGIYFAPALPRRPWRDCLILNWKKSTDTAPDLRPVEGSEVKVGSNLDIGEFRRGELLKKGERTLPAMPEDVKAALPDPNNIVVPMYGY